MQASDALEAKHPGIVRRTRYEWSDGHGGGFHLTGEFVELSPFTRIRHVERLHLPDATPDNDVDTTFEAIRGGTLVTVRMNLPTREAREAMLASGMEHGLEASYARLEPLASSAQS